MAGDQGIANAYAQYFQAQEMDNLQSDPFYVFTQIAAQAAQEWIFEKKKDKERAQKKGEAMQSNIDEMFITASDGYNQQGKDLMHSTMKSFADQMDFAVQSSDKKAMNRIAMDAQTVASEFKRGQAILKDHSAALANGDYSEGAATATLNKLLAGGEEDYAIYMETDPEKPNYLKPFFQIKDNDGGVSLLSFDELDKGNVRRADAFGSGYDKLIKGMVKESVNTGVYEFDAGQVERLLDKSLANGDVLYSAFHDNIFGERESIKDGFNANYKANRDWQNIWNDKIPAHENVVSGGQGVANSGYNETAIREITKSKLMSMAEKEYDMRLKAYQKKVSASKSTTSHPYSINPGTYTYVPGMEKGAIGADKVRAVKHIEANKKFAYNNNMVYKPTDKGWMVKAIDEDVDEYKPIELEDMIAQLGLPMDIKFKLP